MELKGHNVEVYLSTPLILHTVKSDPMILKGKVVDQTNGGFLLLIEQTGTPNDAKIPFKTIFIPLSKIDFIGLA